MNKKSCSARYKKNTAHIVGMGIVSSIGNDITSFSASLMDGMSGIRYSKRITRPPLAVNIMAEITDFNFIKLIQSIPNISNTLLQLAIRNARNTPIFVQTAVVAALQAWHQAGLSSVGKNSVSVLPERIGLVVSGHNTTQNYQYELFRAFQKHPEYLSPRYALQCMDSNLIGVISTILNICGDGLVCGGASASGNIGIIQGLRLIQADIVDICLILGVMTDLSPMEIQSFYTLGAMGGKIFRAHPDKACRPFDVHCEGFIYGQASGCVILESSISIKKRNMPSLACLMGGAIKLHATALAEPNQDAEISVMCTALQQSGLEIKDVDYLNTHGTSSPLGDFVEIEAIERTFGTYFSKLWLNSTKGLSGHCLCSAGVVEAIATVIQMQNNFIHPNLNLNTSIKKNARFNGATAISSNIITAMSNSFGFSGINTSIVLKKYAL